MRWTAWVWFLGLWSLLVYLPVAHWVFAGGWLAESGALDFAGGTVVHINAGAGALALVLAARKAPGLAAASRCRRTRFRSRLLGTGILWFGWFGFNAGSAFAANGVAAQAFLNTFVAASAGMLGWLVVERVKTGTRRRSVPRRVPLPVSWRSRRVPASSAGSRPIVIGAVAGGVCFLAIRLKFRFGYDDSLDVVAVHLVGGIIGSVLLGLFADDAVNPAGKDGVFFGGGWALFGEQILAVVVVLVFSFVVSALIGARAEGGAAGRHPREPRTRKTPDSTLTQHAETGYALERV